MLVGELIQTSSDQGLMVMCRLCGHRGFWKPLEACLAFGEETQVEAIPGRMKCKSCGHRGANHFAVALTDEIYATSPYLAFAKSPQHIRCHGCWHEELVSVEEALMRFGAQATFQAVRDTGRCSKCNAVGFLRVGSPVRDLYKG